MSYLTTMRSHVTPIPTPVIVRLVTSALFASTWPILTSDLSNTSRALITMGLVAAGTLMVYGHPYRKAIRAYIEQHNNSYKPNPATLLPLFPLWLALMVAPAITPLAWGWMLVGWILIFWWLWTVFPHIDGTRALAYLDKQ
ncbi:hypothetical protein ACFPVT_09665 [Corynebacterium choanae]|nr:hypothetical protein [Corynebacterium choanae]